MKLYRLHILILEIAALLFLVRDLINFFLS